MKYPLTFYVDKLGADTAGEARGPIIRILKEYKDDVGIYKHELLHVKQWFQLAILSIPIAAILYHYALFDFISLAVLPIAFHAFLYKFSHTYRLWSEVEAYKVQNACYKDDRSKLFAYFIAGYYNLKVTEAEVLKLLKK
jgi:hypothetical protein